MMGNHHLPHDTELVVQGRIAQVAVRTFTQVLSVFSVVMSAFIFYGGRQRFFGVSYEYALDTLGAPWSWAGVLLSVGVASFAGTILGRPRVTAWAMFLGSWWAFFFAVAFGRAALAHPTASNTAPVAYLAFSALFAVAAVVHGLRSRLVPSLSPPTQPVSPLPDPLLPAPSFEKALRGQPASSRHVMVVFLIGLCAVSGVSILTRTSPPPGSIEALVPRAGVLMWASALCGGALLWLVAVGMQKSRLVVGVLLEQVAAVMLGSAGIFYGAAALKWAGSSALVPAGIVTALGVCCLYRWFELQRWVRSVKRAA